MTDATRARLGTPKPAPARRRAWPWLLLAAALGLWAFEATHRGQDVVPPGAAAPPLELVTEEGHVSLATERGHVVVLAFWATWCGACRAEAPVLAELERRIRPHGDRVLAVSVDQLPLPELRRAADALGLRVPVARATPRAVAAYGVELLPTLYVIDSDGRVAETFTGAVDRRTLLGAVRRAREGAAQALSAPAPRGASRGS